MTDPRLHTAGVAARLTVLVGDAAEVYERVHVRVEREHGLVHVLSEDAATHYMTVPVTSVLIEWNDAAALAPKPRIPAFGAGTLEGMAEQMQRMFGGIGGGIEP